ncbi:MAG: hypothetical protein N2482_00900 [Patescibacteria group bacterium]|nr:hypothetical protein [Patescibacteria group bacterium]
MSIPIVFEFFGVLSIIKAFFYQVSIPAIISSFPLSFIIVFIISRINKKFLEYHPIKTYLIRFLGIILILIGIMKIK